MSEQKATVSKTTYKKGRDGYWRTLTIKGECAFRSPDGHIYYGTAKEIREANLYPWERDALAESLKTYRQALSKGKSLSDIAAAQRRDTIRNRRAQYLINGNSDGAMDRKILTRAAARYLGKSESEFIADSIDAFISAAIADCQQETGEALPLTKYETTTLKSSLRDWLQF